MRQDIKQQLPGINWDYYRALNKSPFFDPGDFVLENADFFLSVIALVLSLYWADKAQKRLNRRLRKR